MSDPFRPRRLFDTEKRCFITDIDYLTQYAILSHRWDQGNELTYNQLLSYGSRPTPNAKFEKFCEVASTKYGLRYVWMDSVCIKRDSTAELMYSIRSMFWWYKMAKVCIVYLADAFDSQSFPSASWFTRGWTLQELLAPDRVVFYYGDWTRISNQEFDIYRSSEPRGFFEDGSEGKHTEPGDSLQQSIAKAAGVDESLLSYGYTPSSSNLETVLTWAQGRSSNSFV
ncbi:hypothetical protein ONZ45_g7255 [Pleurotus djamor]|nr:hypothetical protein ONZ45_g7255 [Pleurotus djamor]